MTGTHKARQEPEYGVGDRVSIDWGGRRIDGVVVEDRGNLGVGGRRILRVRFRFDEDNEDTFELPVEELRPAV